jgi:hypothetical protein
MEPFSRKGLPLYGKLNAVQLQSRTSLQSVHYIFSIAKIFKFVFPSFLFV